MNEDEDEKELISMLEGVNKALDGKDVKKCHAVIFTLMENLITYRGVSAIDSKKAMDEIYEIYCKYLNKE